MKLFYFYLHNTIPELGFISYNSYTSDVLHCNDWPKHLEERCFQV